MTIDPSMKLFFRQHGDDYCFKLCPFSLQKMFFYPLKGCLSRYKRMPFANLLEACGNRK